LACFAGSFQYCPVPMKIENSSAANQPKQPQVIDAGKWPLAIHSQE
jgi:hypothetical protein